MDGPVREIDSSANAQRMSAVAHNVADAVNRFKPLRSTVLTQLDS